MKSFNKEKLDQVLWTDSTMSMPLSEVINGETVPLTVRTILKQMLDKPQKDKPFTRDMIKSLDRIELALSSQEDKIMMDDVDFDFLSKHIDAIGITHRQVYTQVVDLLDSAA